MIINKFEFEVFCNLMYYIKTFMKVLFLAAYSNLVAASRIKVYQFLPFLEKKGIKYRVICFTPSFLYRLRVASENNKKILSIYYPLSFIIRFYNAILAVLSAPNFDIVYINEPIMPFLTEKLLKLANKNIIFQFSDAVFLNNQSGDTFFGKIKSKALFGCWKRLVIVAKRCLADNEYTKQAALKFCPDTEIITGPIDTERYFFAGNNTPQDEIVIGWIGSAFTTKYLYEVKDALSEISKKYSILLRLIGAKKDFNMPGIKYDIKDWSLDSELLWLKTFDIGIAPLTDDAWVQGKASYKILQYMSMGIPCVASAIGFHNEIIQNGHNGFLAKSTQEWVKNFSELIENKNLREKIGRNSRILIEENYSLNKTADKLIEIFKNI